ncbi:hypothetical protein KCP75_24630 [Salmonella enterica subsp. enterica]|nr:hypothetical protein KCP75_24630 [Salmonella enterica subsp. enterica]
MSDDCLWLIDLSGRLGYRYAFRDWHCLVTESVYRLSARVTLLAAGVVWLPDLLVYRNTGIITPLPARHWSSLAVTLLINGFTWVWLSSGTRRIE